MFVLARGTRTRHSPSDRSLPVKLDPSALLRHEPRGVSSVEPKAERLAIGGPNVDPASVPVLDHAALPIHLRGVER